jgi:NAD(P)H-nitrite reductase large subunit
LANPIWPIRFGQSDLANPLKSHQFSPIKRSIWFANSNMSPDDPVCLCFHVTRRKVINFIRVEKPKRPSQLSQCFGAGTGCGWCRSYLERLLKSELDRGSSAASQGDDANEVSFEEYASQRANYVREGGGTPPAGAMPIDNTEPEPPSQ